MVIRIHPSETKLVEPLTPPSYHQKLSEHHWIESFDYDGRSTGICVLQWQPGVRSWCHSGLIATGQDIQLDANHNRWVGVCPMPDLENDKVILGQLPTLATKAHRNLATTGQLEPTDLPVIRELLILHGSPI